MATSIAAQEAAYHDLRRQRRLANVAGWNSLTQPAVNRQAAKTTAPSSVASRRAAHRRVFQPHRP
jgi:hypothetical protein